VNVIFSKPWIKNKTVMLCLLFKSILIGDHVHPAMENEILGGTKAT